MKQFDGADRGQLVKRRDRRNAVALLELRDFEREAILERVDGALVPFGIERGERMKLPPRVDEDRKEILFNRFVEREASRIVDIGRTDLAQARRELCARVT